MKKLILNLILLISINSYGQLAVTAPVLEQQAIQETINSLEIISIGTKTFTEAKKTVNSLQKVVDAVEKVSSFIENSKMVLDLKDKSIALGNKYYTYLLEVRNDRILNNEEKEFIIEVYSEILKDGTKAFEGMGKILSSDFKMNDFERLSFIEKISRELTSQLDLMDYFNLKVKKQIRKEKRNRVNKEFFNKKNY